MKPLVVHLLPVLGLSLVPGIYRGEVMHGIRVLSVTADFTSQEFTLRIVHQEAESTIADQEPVSVGYELCRTTGQVILLDRSREFFEYIGAALSDSHVNGETLEISKDSAKPNLLKIRLQAGTLHLDAFLTRLLVSNPLFGGKYCGSTILGKSKETYLLDVDVASSTFDMEWLRNGQSVSKHSGLNFQVSLDEYFVGDWRDTSVTQATYDPQADSLSLETDKYEIILKREHCRYPLLRGFYNGVGPSAPRVQVIPGLRSVRIRILKQSETLTYTSLDEFGEFFFTGPSKGISLFYAADADGLYLRTGRYTHVLFPDYIITQIAP